MGPPCIPSSRPFLPLLWLNLLPLSPSILSAEPVGHISTTGHNPRDNHKPKPQPGINNRNALIPCPSRPPGLLAAPVHPLMADMVKVRRSRGAMRRVLARSHAPSHTSALTPAAAAHPTTLLMRSLPLGAVRAPPAGAVEARRRTGKGASPARQAGGGTAAGGAGGGVGAAAAGGVVVGGGGQAHVVAVVARALVGVAEDVVGFAYALEPGRGLRVGGVVWVVALAERVEGSGWWWWRRLVGMVWGRGGAMDMGERWKT